MLHRAAILFLTTTALLTAVLFPHSSPKHATTYSTRFSHTENPISEGGNWTNGKADGVDWFDVETTPGKAFGNQTTGEYTDPTAILKGTWGPDQTVTAKVFCAKPTSSYDQEVEIRLRSTITAHNCTGYEIFWRCLTDSNAYTHVARWNGPVRDFTYIDNKHEGVGYGVANGDTVSASIVGNLISVYRNGALLFTVTDSTYTIGNPGMGFNYGVGTTNADFGFTSYAATDTVISSQSHFPVRTDDGTASLVSLGRGWDGLWLTSGFIKYTFTNAKQLGNEFVRLDR
jgi:hypothetical protein